MPAMFLGEDFASGDGPMVSPAFLRKSFFPRLKRIADAYHRKGIRLLFHSDGDLHPVLDDLVACGIDALNPIDIASGMDPKEIRRRHPNLVLVGGIDCARLLPFGSPGEVRQATRALIEAAGPALLVGSSSETGDDVPLDNFLAMVEVARNWRY
jgi:uroporphyrinogen decarboxylase